METVESNNYENIGVISLNVIRMKITILRSRKVQF
jgi:hypothetical protein